MCRWRKGNDVSFFESLWWSLCVCCFSGAYIEAFDVSPYFMQSVGFKAQTREQSAPPRPHPPAIAQTPAARYTSKPAQ